MKKLFVLLLTIFMLAGVLAGCAANKQEEPPVDGDSMENNEYPVHEVENMIIFGIDDKSDGRDEPETDAIKLVSLDYDDQVVRVFSIPRDLLVVSNDQIVPINKIYSKLGIDGSIAAINDLTGLDIKKYAAFDYAGLKALVEKLGGVEIELSQAEIEKNSLLGLTLTLS